ncbi:MAG: 50S ribosomal protein L6 [Deltaproteobacteria bacterium]|nr:50S ribosomal protein L6 [Deltaproteobacteria bacterium]
MSRIGKKPVTIPSGVSVTMKSGGIEVKGPRGTLFQSIAKGVGVTVEGGNVLVSRNDMSREARGAHGLVRTLISNMVTGVTEGFSKRLEIVGVGYRAEVQGKDLVLALGFSHPIRMPIPKGLAIKAERPTVLLIEGADRQEVGQFAATVRGIRAPDPYKGKGVKYADERIRRKVGKAGASAGAK